MNPIMDGNGELPLLSENIKVIPFDGLEQWQIDQLISPIGDSYSHSNACLMNIDYIVTDWLKQLTQADWNKIKRQESLFGIKLPEQWIRVWRLILKEPNLRDRDKATKMGRGIGTFSHLWGLWAEDSINLYLNDLELELLYMVDMGYLYSEIGQVLLNKYGDKFWKPRKANSKTTVNQVVNNYLYWKMPNKIARCELRDIVQTKLERLNK